MREFWLFVVYLFAAIGITQCLNWLIYLCRRLKICRDGWYVIPVYDTPAEIEACLRSSLALLRWNGTSMHTVLLLDMGLGEESLAICERFIRQNPGLILCDREQVGTMIEKLSVSYDTT